jgi:hypothetical protein
MMAEHGRLAGSAGQPSVKPPTLRARSAAGQGLQLEVEPAGPVVDAGDSAQPRFTQHVGHLAHQPPSEPAAPVFRFDLEFQLVEGLRSEVHPVLGVGGGMRDGEVE